MRALKKYLRNENGFWSALFVLVLTALAALGFSTYTTVRIEGSNAANQAQMLRADYAATAGAYMGLKLYQDSTLFSQKSFSLSDASVVIQVVQNAVTGRDVLTSAATYNGTRKKIQIELDPNRDLSQMAIYTMGNVNDVIPYNSSHVVDWTRMKANADSVPTIRTADLIALSTLQGHNKFGNWTTPNDWCGSFWNAPGVPNVTYVNGNMTMNGSDHCHGIYVVTGTVTMNGNCHVDGVFYLPNVTSTIIHGSGSTDDSIDGGIVSHGNITGHGSHVDVQHNPAYMKAFCKYQRWPTTAKQKVVTWKSVSG